MARVVETLAGRLPALEELEASAGFDVDTRAGALARTQLIMCTIADFFPRLRRLVLPLPGNTSQTGLGALAACAQLRELTVLTGTSSRPRGLTQAALEGLDQLQQLERLTLGHFRLRAGDEQLLTRLLATHRPPNLLTLKLLTEVALEVEFERAAGASAQARGMHCVVFDDSNFSACAMQRADQLARAVLAAADQLQQPTVPDLAFGRLWLSREWRPPQLVQPGDPLPSLVARYGRVRLDCMYGLQGAPNPAQQVLALVRLMGLPLSLDLLHGCWQPHAHAQELASRGAAVGAAEPGGDQPAGGPAAPAPVERRQTRQMNRLQRQEQGAQQQQQQQQQQQGERSQQLQLGTATPEQVLLTVLDELEAEAALARASRGCGGGGGSRAAGGRVVLLRGALPPKDEGPMAPAAWVKGAVAHCIRLAVQAHARRQQPERSRGGDGAPPTAGPPSSIKQLERCWELINAACCHVAAPSVGVLLLDCGGNRSATELAALLSGAAWASSVQQRDETGTRAVTTAVVQERRQQSDRAGSTVYVLRDRVFKVLTDMWARSLQGGGGGTNSSSSSSSSNRKVANEDALRQLLALDNGVYQLWDPVSVEGPSSAESEDDDGDDEAGLLW
ncbi:hypothetical protein HXX76_009626 [Chlamydomonas incerta]|nr:hypothetical protein HXX76_009626 [Chlamydomonas incerta]|eukprot:KAG2431094.1 hypothetical protein HXX76_009626 [Chlamydomonas incerta]